ncbi:MAG: hypothetical protein ACYS8W_08305 [Planctomycetota bacterium]
MNRNKATRLLYATVFAGAVIISCGCASAKPEPAISYVAKNLWFDEARPISVKINTVKLPDTAANTPWWAFFPGILYGTWRKDAAEDFASSYGSVFHPTFDSSPITLDEQDPEPIGLSVSTAFTSSIATCLGCAGIFETVSTHSECDFTLDLEFTVFRRNTRLYTYGLTPLVAAVTFWAVGCPFRGVWYEFELNGSLTDRNGETLWEGNSSGISETYHGACWTGHGPECRAFNEAYIRLISSLFKDLAKNLPPPDDPIWKKTEAKARP